MCKLGLRPRTSFSRNTYCICIFVEVQQRRHDILYNVSFCICSGLYSHFFLKLKFPQFSSYSFQIFLKSTWYSAKDSANNGLDAELEVISGSVLALDEGIGPLLNPDDKATMDFKETRSRDRVRILRQKRMLQLPKQEPLLVCNFYNESLLSCCCCNFPCGEGENRWEK